MRILWASVAPWCGSGYGVQTALVAPRLQLLDHDVAIACNKGLEGGILPWPGPRAAIPVLPNGKLANRHQMDKVAAHAAEFQADVIISHYDAWTLDQKRLGEDAFNHPWVPWFPIDTDDVSTKVLNAVRGLRGAAYRITQTRHGQAAMHSHNEQCAYVPAAYDPNVYYPHDQQDAKRILELGEGRFLAVMVAANSGTPNAPSRKSFPQVFQAWKWFTEQHPDALLYVHAMPQGHLNLDAMMHEYGLSKNVQFAEPYPLYAGAIDQATMRLIYSAADVFVNPSMGEGFGVPIIEAQACGTPVIAGDWTSMSEVTREGHLIPKDDAARYQMVGYGGDQYIPKSEAILDALEASTTWVIDPAIISSGVAEYQIDTVWHDHWTPVLAEIEDLLGHSHARLEREQTDTLVKELLA